MIDTVISQKVSKCRECGKPLAIFLLDGVLIKNKQYPGTEEVCRDCLPTEMRQEIDKNIKNLRKTVVDALKTSKKNLGNVPPDANQIEL